MSDLINDQDAQEEMMEQVNPEWQARIEMGERLQRENTRISIETQIKAAKSHARQHALQVVIELFKETGYPVTKEEMTEYVISRADEIYQFLIKDL